MKNTEHIHFLNRTCLHKDNMARLLNFMWPLDTHKINCHSMDPQTYVNTIKACLSLSIIEQMVMLPKEILYLRLQKQKLTIKKT